MKKTKRKNVKHTALGYILAIATLLASVILLYHVQATIPHPIPVKVLDVEPVTKQYQNDEFGFKFDYDKNYELNTSGTQKNFFKYRAKTVATVSIPQNSAYATVAVQPDSEQSSCEAKRVIKGIKKVNYKTRVFRAFENDNCYEISFTVSGMAGKVDESEIWSKLMQIMSSFVLI